MKNPVEVNAIIAELERLYPDALCSLEYKKDYELLFAVRLRYMACVAGGMLVGLGGAVLSTGILSQFTENMTDGRGFIALAAVTFGKYTPFGTLGGVIVFGIGETLSYRLQAGGGAFPYEFALMLPYVLTVLALCAFSRNAKDPAALGVPYYKSH